MKKKILFYTSGVGLGGVEKVILQVLKSIDKNKFDIKLGLQYANENLFEDEIPKEINYKYMLPMEVINKSLYYRSKKKNIFYKILYSFLLKYEKYLIKKNYLEFSKDRDIVIDFKSGDFLKLILLNKNAKKICWLHGEVTKLNRWEKRKKFLRQGMNQCDKIITLCEEMKDNLLYQFSELENKIEIITNPFDIEKIRELSNNKDELNLEERNLIKEDYIVSVTRLDNVQKDLDTLIKVYYNLKCREKLYIVGEGPYRKEIEKKIEELNLQDRIKLLGLKRNPYCWIKNAKVFLLTSKYEGLPTVLIEALLLNKLIVATSCPTGPKDILEYGKYGMLVDVGDVEGISQAVLTLLNEDSRERKKIFLNIDKISNKYNCKEVITKIEKMLEIL